MPTFHYKAKNQEGAPVEGSLDSESRAGATEQLRRMGYFPISVAEKGANSSAAVATGEAKGNSITRLLPKLAFGGSAPAMSGSSAAVPRPSGVSPRVSRAVVKPKTLNNQAQAAAKKVPVKAAGKAPVRTTMEKNASAASSGGFFSRNRVTSSDLAAFNRQMADLLGAGIPLVKALTILQKQSDNPRLQEIITNLNADVSGGATFADALAKHPMEFSKLYVAMVRSGEAGGMLDDVLKRLADYSESEELTKSKIKSALAYPVVMMIAGAVAIAVMFIYIIPKITGVFKELNQTLPAITQVLITVSEFAQGYWYIVLGVMVALLLGIAQVLKTQEGMLFWHKTQIRLPLFGDLVRKQEVSRFSRTLGSLLKNGVSILTALKITREVLKNELVKAELDAVIEGITQGQGMAEPLRNSQFFPPVAINMMTVGEETGQLENVLLRISDSYESEVDRKIRTLTSLIEPLIIVIMGLVVGFIVIAMLLPIFSLNPGAA
jgi:type II secretion system protein F